MVALSGTAKLWTYRRIPYEFEAEYPCSSDVRDAMDKWEQAAGVSFVLHRDEPNYLVIKNPASGSSSSKIGMQGGEQDVYIEIGYKALHELGHALGLIHEQQRSNRDTYVDIQWDNITNGKSNSDFTLVSDSQNLTDYDPASVMHYPAPATGWQGKPADQEVWTMRWKDDQNKTLGPEKWSELSELDKSAQALYTQYLTMPVPMGAETANGTWGNPYAVQFPFAINGRQFFYGQNLDTNYWFIQELLAGGTIGAETANGTWSNAYAVQFPFAIGGKQYFYGHNLGTKYWFIQELNSDGTMGAETADGTWSNAYAVQFPFAIGGKQYFYGHNLDTKYWFIQELNSDGTMGAETANGYWGNAYAVQFPYAIGDRHYLYGQNQDTNYWFIQRLEAEGKMGDELQGSFWQQAYGVQFPFVIGGNQYFYGQNLTDDHYYFIQQLLDVS